MNKMAKHNLTNMGIYRGIVVIFVIWSASISVVLAASNTDNTEKLLHADPLSLIQVDLGSEIEAEIAASVDKEYQQDYHFETTRVSLLDILEKHDASAKIKEYAARMAGQGISLMDMREVYLHRMRRQIHHKHRLKIAKHRGLRAYKSHIVAEPRFQGLRGQMHTSKLTCEDRKDCESCIHHKTSKKHCAWRIDSAKSEPYCSKVSLVVPVPSTVTASYGKKSVKVSMAPTKCASCISETCPDPAAIPGTPTGGESGVAADILTSKDSSEVMDELKGEIDSELEGFKAEAKADAVADAKMQKSTYDKRMLEASKSAEDTARKIVIKSVVFKDLVSDIKRTTEEEVALLKELKAIAEEGLTKESCEKKTTAELVRSMATGALETLQQKVLKFAAYVYKMAVTAVAAVIKSVFFLVKFIGNLLLELKKLLVGNVKRAAQWIKTQSSRLRNSRCSPTDKDVFMNFCPADDPFNKNGKYTCYCRPDPGSPTSKWWPMGGLNPTASNSIPAEDSTDYNNAIDICASQAHELNAPSAKRSHAECKDLWVEKAAMIKAELPTSPEKLEGNGCYKYEREKLNFDIVYDLTDTLMESYEVNAKKFRTDMISDDAVCNDGSFATCKGGKLMQGTCKDGSSPICTDKSSAKPLKMMSFENMKTLKAIQLTMVNNRELERDTRNFCASSKVWQAVSILASPISLGREALAELLPDLVILSTYFTAFGSVSGLEVVTDHQTYENSVFAYGGLNTGASAGAGIGMGIGFGWKGSTSHTPVEESYKGWFVGAEPSAAPPIPPWSLLGYLCAGFYSSGAPDDGTLEISAAAKIAEDRIASAESKAVAIGDTGSNNEEEGDKTKSSGISAAKAAAAASSLKVLPLLHAVKSFEIGLSVGPSISLNMPGNPLSVAYVQTFYVYLAGTCTSPSEGSGSNRWMHFISKMLIDSVKSMHPGLILSAVVNAVYGIFHRLVNGPRGPVDEQCSIHSGKNLEFRRVLKGAFGNKHVIPQVGYLPPEITKSQVLLKGELRDTIAIAEADNPTREGTNMYENWKGLMGTVLVKRQPDSEARNEAAEVEMDDINSPPVKDQSYGCYIESLKKYAKKLTSKTKALHQDLQKRIYGSQLPPETDALSLPLMKTKKGSYAEYMYSSLSKAARSAMSAASAAQNAILQQDKSVNDMRTEILASTMCQLDYNLIDNTGIESPEGEGYGAESEGGNEATTEAGSEIANKSPTIDVLAQLQEQSTAKHRFAASHEGFVASEAAKPVGEGIMSSDIKNPLCKSKQGNDYFAQCDANCHPLIPKMDNTIDYDKVGSPKWDRHNGGGAHFFEASIENALKFSPWELGAPPSDNYESRWMFKQIFQSNPSAMAVKSQIEEALLNAHKSLKLYLMISNRRREFLEIEFEHQVRRYSSLRDSNLAWSLKYDIGDSFPDQRQQLYAQAEKLVAGAYPPTREPEFTPFGGGESHDDIAKEWAVAESVPVAETLENTK